MLAVSVLVSIIILIGGIVMVTSDANPYGPMSFIGALLSSLFVLIAALFWWAPIMVLAEMAESIAALRINSERQQF